MTNQSNPFLAAVVPYLPVENLPERLAFSPLTGVDIRSLSIDDRLDLLDRLQEEYFEPTSSSLDIASRLFRLIRRGYAHRDPTQPSVRKMTMEIAGYRGQELSRLPWFSTYAKCMTVMGITGLGKSYEVDRALSLIPQCIEHGPCKAAGWAKMKQVVWLKVAMSHDGSLGGFLLQILTELDMVLGTEYSQDSGLKRLSNEKLSVLIGIIFRNHGVGVLVVDELQKRNFEGGGHGNFTVTFFLRLLNFGVPTVLIGNPFGFEALQTYSQDVRRIGTGGTIHVHPLNRNDFDWVKCLVPALSKLSVMNEPHHIENLEELLFRYSGGIRDYAIRVLFAAQRIAIELDCHFINEQHLVQAFFGSDLGDKDRDTINGFVNKDPSLLMQYEDIPWKEYEREWAKSKRDAKPDVSESHSEKVATPANDINPSATEKPVSAKDAENMRRQRTRKTNESIKKQGIKKTLSPEDMRSEGLREHLIEGIDGLMGNNRA